MLVVLAAGLLAAGIWVVWASEENKNKQLNYTCMQVQNVKDEYNFDITNPVGYHKIQVNFTPDMCVPSVVFGAPEQKY